MSFGRSFSNLTNRIGKSFSYDKLRQFGNSVAKQTVNGLHTASQIGGQVSGIINKVEKVADGLRSVPVIGSVAGLVGTGLSQARMITNLARQGVDGLEKVTKHAIDVGKTVDKHSSLGKSIMSGDTKNVISAAKEVTSVASRNPFSV